MAIEFDCPYCTATIRVPDAYGGREGRCPKCNTRLLVPTVVRPGTVEPSQVSPQNSPVAPAASAQAMTSGADASSAPADPSTLSFPDPRKPLAPSARRKGRRRPSRALVIGMPVLGFLILLGIIGYIVTTMAPSLSGDLKAIRITNDAVSRSMIPWSDTGLDETQQATIQEALRANPEVLTSELMTCRLIGTEEGIAVQLTSSASTEWVAIETASDQNKTLGLWLRKERNNLNMARVSELQAAVRKYCSDKLAQLDGQKAPLDAISIRDDVALNAGGGPLSFVTQALIGKRAIRVAAESEQGQLLVCVPKGTLAFELTGRSGKDGRTLFAGRYNVIINPAAPKAPTSDADDAKKAEPAEGDMQDSDDSKDAMKDSDAKKGENDSESMDEPANESKSSEPMMKEPAMMDGAMKAPVPLMNGSMKDEEMMDQDMGKAMDGEMQDGDMKSGDMTDSMDDAKKPAKKKSGSTK
jgi:hypothetical protein